MGIKVIWFGNESDALKMNDIYSEFYKNHLLQTFEYTDENQFTIIDGDLSDHLKDFELLKKNSKFNSHQYIIEHYCDTNLSIQASAGTGKTTVMIDRILYLLDMDPTLQPSQIVMITFTNNATEQMRERLQDAALTKYRLTRDVRFLALLEKTPQIRVSTIHSFAINLMKLYAPQFGFSSSMSIKSFKYDMDDIIEDELSIAAKADVPVTDELGMTLYDARRTIYAYWEEFVKKGLDAESIRKLNWGSPNNERSSQFQSFINKVLSKLDARYLEIKRKNDATSVSDAIRDLNMMVNQVTPSSKTIDIRYIFVDEFQDTDDDQIGILSAIATLTSAKVFVVGDIKQSIYRFRGADETAFLTLAESLKSHGNEIPTEEPLVYNYRTSKMIIEKLNECFNEWNTRGLLPFKNNAIAARDEIDGSVIPLKIHPSELDSEIVRFVKESLFDLEGRVDSNKPKPSDKVTLLVRKNEELIQLKNLFKSNHIPANVRHEGAFYISDAVRDFFSMGASFAYRDPSHIFNYLTSPYCALDNPIKINDLLMMSGDSKKILNAFNPLLEKTNWDRYDRLMREMPPVYVLNKIVDESNVIANYIASRKRILSEEGWVGDALNEQTYLDAKQYKADLDKLLSMLHEEMGGTADIYGIIRFLSIMIQTNRDEESAPADTSEDYHCVHCMTVHKAKGLEFDTVLLPYTDNKYIINKQCDILIDKKALTAGWCATASIYDKTNHKKTKHKMKNNYYHDLKNTEDKFTEREEARILYVAMTRAIRKLAIIRPANYSKKTWADLLTQGGLFN